MKRFDIFLPALLCALLLNGCLFKKAQVPTREFILTPVPAAQSAPAARATHFEVGAVKMPSYLLRESITVRRSASEFKYFDNAHWAERLDQSFRRALTENLSSLLASEETHSASTNDAESKLLVAVDVKQFDVDTEGHGILLATWRLTRPGSDEPPKSSHSQLKHDGPIPKGNPQVVATTLSALTAQFSRDLAKEIRGYAPTGNR